MRRLLLAFFTVGMIGTSIPAHSQESGALELDNSGKGAVLCIHWLYAEMYQYMLLCRPQETEAIEALSESLHDFETFIARNSDLSLEEAQRLTILRRKAALNQSVHLEKATCTHAKKELIQFVEGLAPEKVIENTAEILSIDRKPVMNPCL